MADNFQLEEDDFESVTDPLLAAKGWPERAATEEAYYTANMMDDGEVVDNFTTTKTNLMVAGEDERASGIRQSRSADYNTSTGNVLAEIVADPLLDDRSKQEAISSLSNISPKDVDLEGEYEMDEASKDENSIAWQWLEERESRDDEIAAIAQEELDRIDEATGVVGFLSDFVGSAFPFSIRETYADVGRTVLGDAFDITDTTTTMKAKIKTAIRNAPGDQLEPLVRKTIETINENAGLLNNNSVIKTELISELFNEYLTGSNPEATDINGIMNDAFDVLDVIGVGQIAKTSVRGVGKMLGSPLRNTVRSNPAKAEKMVASVIDDESGRVAKELGITKSEAIEALLPKPDFLKVKLDDVATSKVLMRGQEIQEEILAITRKDVGQFSSAERTMVKQKFVDQLENIEGARLHLPSSTFKVAEDESGVVVKAVYAQGDSKPFNTAEEALAKGKELFGSGSHVKVLRAKPATREAEEVSKSSIKREAAKQQLTPQEHVDLTEEIAQTRAALATAKSNGAIDDVQVGKIEAKISELETKLNAAEIVEVPSKTPGYYIQLVDRRGFITQNFKTSDLELTPNAISLKWLASSAFGAAPTARFAEQLSAPGLRSLDIGNAIQAKLNQIINKPFVKLPSASKVKIIDKLSEGARAEEIFDRGQLLALGWQEREVDGYLAVRQFMDTLYLINNDKLYASLLKTGDKTVVNKTSGYQSVGRVLDDAELSEVKTVFDPTNGTIIPYDKALRESDIKVGVLRSGERVGDDVTKFFIVSGDTQVEAISRYPLRYNKGYITRYYKDRYFITARNKNVLINGQTAKAGQEYKETVHAVSSIKERDKLLAKLNKDAEEGITYDWKHDRGLQQQSREALEEAEWQLNASQGKLFFSPRGKQLGHDKLRAIDDIADVEDPIESMMRAMRVTSNKAATDDLIDSHKARFMNSYRDLTPGGKYPASKDVIASPAGKVTDPRVKEAKAFFDYINTLEGMDNTALSAWWRQTLLELGEGIQGKFSSRLGQFLGRKVGDMGAKDPVSMLKGLTFNILIAANPFRQIVLQTQQIFLLSGFNPSYIFNPAGMLRHHTGLTTGWFARNNPDAWKKVLDTVPQTMGMTKKEYKSLVDNWVNTGLPYSIDSNVLAADAYISASKRLTPDAISKLGASVKNVTTALPRWTKKVGFDVGEYNNLSFTWLSVRDKWIKANPGKDWTSKKALDKIASDARSLSLSMTSADKYAYQKGWLGLATQFLSVQHKAAALMLPERVGGSRLTTGMKRRIFLGQLGFYGLSGLGLREAYNWAKANLGFDLPGFVEDIILGGMGETVVNYSLRAITGDDVDLDISRDFSAASGMYDSITSIIGDVFSGKESVAALVAGPSASALGRIGDAVSFSYGLTKRHDLSNTEVLKRIVQEGPKVFSGYSNYVKAMAMKNLKMHVDQFGDPLTSELYASQTEAYAQLIGVKSSRVTDHWEGVIERAELKKSFKEDAKNLFEQIKKMPLSPEVANNPDARLMIRQADLEGMVLSLIDDEEYRDAIHQETARLLNADERRRGNSSVARDIAGIINGAKADKPTLQYVIDKASQRGQLTDEQKNDMKTFIDYMSKFDATVQ